MFVIQFCGSLPALIGRSGVTSVAIAIVADVTAASTLLASTKLRIERLLLRMIASRPTFLNQHLQMIFGSQKHIGEVR